jgi:hypothetical protein
VATIITRRKQEKNNSLNGAWGGGREKPRKNNQLSSQTQISTTKTSAVGTLLSSTKILLRKHEIWDHARLLFHTNTESPNPLRSPPHTYTHIYTHIHTHIHTDSYIHTHGHTYTYRCIHTYTWTYIYIPEYLPHTYITGFWTVFSYVSLAHWSRNWLHLVTN